MPPFIPVEARLFESSDESSQDLLNVVLSTNSSEIS